MMSEEGIHRVTGLWLVEHRSVRKRDEYELTPVDRELMAYALKQLGAFHLDKLVGRSGAHLAWEVERVGASMGSVYAGRTHPFGVAPQAAPAAIPDTSRDTWTGRH